MQGCHLNFEAGDYLFNLRMYLGVDLLRRICMREYVFSLFPWNNERSPGFRDAGSVCTKFRNLCTFTSPHNVDDLAKINVY